MKPALESLSDSLDKKVSNVVEALSRVQLALGFISATKLSFACPATCRSSACFVPIFPHLFLCLLTSHTKTFRDVTVSDENTPTVRNTSPELNEGCIWIEILGRLWI